MNLEFQFARIDLLVMTVLAKYILIAASIQNLISVSRITRSPSIKIYFCYDLTHIFRRISFLWEADICCTQKFPLSHMYEVLSPNLNTISSLWKYITRIPLPCDYQYKHQHFLCPMLVTQFWSLLGMYDCFRHFCIGTCVG